MRRREQQSGFSTKAILLAIVIVATLAVAGLELSQRHSSSTAKSNAATNQTPTTSQPQRTVATQAAQPTSSYLVIKEWVVKLPLSSAISDAKYVVATNSTDTMWLGLTRLDGTACAASRANTGGAGVPVGAFIRVLPTDHEPIKGTLYTQLYPGATVGDHYFAYISGIKGKTCAPQATLQSVDSAFSAAAKGATAN